MTVLQRDYQLAGSLASDPRTSTPAAEGPIAAGIGARLGRRLLRVPLFYKLVIANGAIALIGVVGSAGLVAAAIRRDPTASLVGIILPVAAAAVGLGVIINALLVRLALTPLRNLERAADQVRAGREDARAAESAVSDAATEQVVRAFNAMLESLSLYRRRLRAVAIRALDAEEAERKRLSGELHDNTAQSLAAILVQLRVARSGLPADQAVRLTAVSDQVSGLINELRQMAQQLRPPALDMLGLGAAITAHVRNISDSAGVRIDVQLDGQLDGAMTRETELALYRIVQEALLNVVRHAGARTARVELRLEPTQLIARVVDDGRGFDVGRAFDNGALGLIGMSERASYIGGSVEIRSRLGAGTSVQITFPIKEARHV